MRKVWIASILTILMLTVPISSVVSANNLEEDCFECQPMNRADYVKVKLLLTRLEVFINIILSKFSHIPKVVTICKEILGIINIGFNDRICNILLNPLYRLIVITYLLSETELGMLIFWGLHTYLKQIFENIYKKYNCENWEPPIGKTSRAVLGTPLNLIRDNVRNRPCMQK